MSIKSHRDLTVWQKAMELVKEVYSLTEKFPKDETFNMTLQMNKAAVSIPSQIAEGYMRRHRKEYLYFLSVSLGSSAELETQILACKALTKFRNLNFSQAEITNTEVMKMLYSMIEKLRI